MTTIAEQAAAVEISAVNLRCHRDNLAMLVAQKKRPQVDLDVAAGRLPALEAAAKTLRWLERNEQKIREAVS